jgi:hypothetical protein
MHATRAVQLHAWRLPAFVREILLVAVAALTYFGVRNLTVGAAPQAFANADRLRDLEQHARIARGATATAVLRITDAYNFPRSACRPTMAAGLRVYPPNQTAAKLVPFPFLACSRTGPVFMSVQAVQPA